MQEYPCEHWMQPHKSQSTPEICSFLSPQARDAVFSNIRSHAPVSAPFLQPQANPKSYMCKSYRRKCTYLMCTCIEQVGVLGALPSSQAGRRPGPVAFQCLTHVRPFSSRCISPPYQPCCASQVGAPPSSKPDAGLDPSFYGGCFLRQQTTLKS